MVWENLNHEYFSEEIKTTLMNPPPPTPVYNMVHR